MTGCGGLHQLSSIASREGALCLSMPELPGDWVEAKRHLEPDFGTACYSYHYSSSAPAPQLSSGRNPSVSQLHRISAQVLLLCPEEMVD